MNTANQQSVGGSVAGAKGEGNLMAARTRNAGGFAPALDESAREGSRVSSNNAIKIQADNARLKEAQRQAGISGLSGLYGGLTGSTLSALNTSNNAYSGASNAYKSPWDTFLGNLGGAAGAAVGGRV